MLGKRSTRKHALRISLRHHPIVIQIPGNILIVTEKVDRTIAWIYGCVDGIPARWPVRPCSKISRLAGNCPRVDIVGEILATLEKHQGVLVPVHGGIDAAAPMCRKDSRARLDQLCRLFNDMVLTGLAIELEIDELGAADEENRTLVDHHGGIDRCPLLRPVGYAADWPDIADATSHRGVQLVFVAVEKSRPGIPEPHRRLWLSGNRWIHVQPDAGSGFFVIGGWLHFFTVIGGHH